MSTVATALLSQLVHYLAEVVMSHRVNHVVDMYPYLTGFGQFAGGEGGWRRSLWIGGRQVLTFVDRQRVPLHQYQAGRHHAGGDQQRPARRRNLWVCRRQARHSAPQRAAQGERAEENRQVHADRPAL